MNYPTTPKPPAPVMVVNDDLSGPVMKAIDQLAADGNMFTRMRLGHARSREAIKLAQHSMVEAMAAKRHVFAVAVSMAQDHACKLLLADSMEKSKGVEAEINSTIIGATEEFMRLVVEREQVAYAIELERISEAQVQFDQGKLSERRYTQLVATIEGATDDVIKAIHQTTHEILNNLTRRFQTALQQQRGRV